MPSLDRRRFLRDAAATTALVSAGGLAAGVATPAQAAPVRPPRPRRPLAARARSSFRWLGTAGWRIDIGDRTVLVDPFLSRIDTGLFTGAFKPDDPVDRATPTRSTRTSTGPETVLVTHTHWDHFNDVPYIAKRTGARVFGTLTAYHLGLAYGLPSTQLSAVKGGEVLDFGDYTVEVVGSLHSRNAVVLGGLSRGAGQPAAAAGHHRRPAGGRHAGATCCRVDGGPSVFFIGRQRLRRAQPHRPRARTWRWWPCRASTTTGDYLPRLLAALDHPKVVVPVHWDNFETPLQNPPAVAPADRTRLNEMIAAVRRISPRSRVLVPEYETAYHF